jgi:hypothetical protein
MRWEEDDEDEEQEDEDDEAEEAEAKTTPYRKCRGHRSEDLAGHVVTADAASLLELVQRRVRVYHEAVQARRRRAQLPGGLAQHGAWDTVRANTIRVALAIVSLGCYERTAIHGWMMRPGPRCWCLTQPDPALRPGFLRFCR